MTVLASNSSSGRNPTSTNTTRKKKGGGKDTHIEPTPNIISYDDDDANDGMSDNEILPLCYPFPLAQNPILPSFSSPHSPASPKAHATKKSKQHPRKTVETHLQSQTPAVVRRHTIEYHCTHWPSGPHLSHKEKVHSD